MQFLSGLFDYNYYKSHLQNHFQQKQVNDSENRFSVRCLHFFKINLCLICI